MCPRLEFEPEVRGESPGRHEAGFTILEDDDSLVAQGKIAVCSAEMSVSVTMNSDRGEEPVDNKTTFPSAVAALETFFNKRFRTAHIEGILIGTPNGRS
jgi:hypothetical protein